MKIKLIQKSIPPALFLLGIQLSLISAPSRVSSSEFRFVETAEPRGIDFVQTNGTREKEYIVEAKGAGVAAVDVNNDGWDDIYFINGQDWSAAPAATPPRNRLFLNRRDGAFEDATDTSGLGDTGFGTGGYFADVDNDGDLDCYLTNNGPNQLYLNDGEGRFTAAPNAGGAQNNGWSTGAAFGDIDGDGDLDLYVSQYAIFSKEIAIKKGKLAPYFGQNAFLGPTAYEPAPDNLFLNNGDGTFRDVTQERGIESFASGRGFTVNFTDLDDDGDLDLYVANDTSMNNLYENKGNGFFEDISLVAGVGLSESGDEQGGMGVAVKDIDGDLDLDILVANYQDEYNILYRNDGKMMLTDATFVTGIGQGSIPAVSFGALLEDFNNDTWPDLHISTGHVYPMADQLPMLHGYAQPALFYQNLGQGKYENISDRIGPASELKAVSRGSAAADFDRDGDLDIVVNNLDGKPFFLENQSTSGYWLQIALQNHRGVPAYGARAIIEAGGRKQIAELYSSHSFLSQNSADLHFGLAQNEAVERIEIRWPDGSKEEQTDIKANQRVVIRQKQVSR